MRPRVVPHDSRVVGSKTGQNEHLNRALTRARAPAAAAAHLQSTGGTVLRDMVTTRGRVPAMSAIDQAAKFSNRGEQEARTPTQWYGVFGFTEFLFDLFVCVCRWIGQVSNLRCARLCLWQRQERQARIPRGFGVIA